MVPRKHRPLIPAICQVGNTVYGGQLHYDPLSAMGYMFEYIDRKGKIHRTKETFKVLLMA